VLAHDGGAFPRMSLPFRYCLEENWGAGKQAMSFIHIEDLVRAFDFLIHHQLSGVVNMVSPEFTSNADFTRELSKQLHKPAFFTVLHFSENNL